MKPSQVVLALKTAVLANRPVMLYGTPGIGKSDMVRQVCAELDYDVVDIRVSQLDPVDIRGIPIVDQKTKRTEWSKPSWWPQAGKKTALFFDELNSGAQAVMAACYQIILDRALGEHVLPPDTIIFAAGNNVTDGGVVNVMPTPLKNRFIHIDVDVDTDEWAQWAVKAGVRSEIISLIRYKPTLLNEFDRVNRGTQTGEDRTEDNRKRKALSFKDLKAFATPRTWAFCSQLMNVTPPREVAFQLYAGTVGDGPATELVAHIELHHKLPDFDLIIKSPDKAPVPSEDEPAVMYSLATSLGAKADAKTFGPILRYSNRMPPEFAITMAKDALMRDRTLSDVCSKEFNEWAKTHSGILL